MALRCGLNVDPGAEYGALLPELFAQSEVSALEWSWELGRAPWLAPLCNLFAQHGALSVHLVQYPLNGDDATLATALARTRRECAQRRPALLSVHYGVTAVRGFRTVAPLPVVPCRAAAEEAIERLGALKEAAGCPVGVENLAIAFSADDVRRQAEVFWALIDADPEHFVLLDLHNLYCQAHNFGFALDELLDLYPLDRVREVHLAGGSWWQRGDATFRRDTHDHAVPDEVFELLQQVRARAPSLEFVIVERMAHTLQTAAQRREHLADCARVLAALEAPVPRRAEARATPHATREPALPERPHDEARAFEAELVAALLESEDERSLRARLSARHPHYADWIAAADPRALEVARLFERRWAERG